MSNKRVLLVEDEPLVSMVIADMLDELGYEVVMAGSDVKGATDSARAEQVDLAVLDLAIEDGSTFPVAEILRERGIPFIFVTGFEADAVDDRFSEVPVLQKPIERQMLQKIFVPKSANGGAVVGGKEAALGESASPAP